jgi:hypothetical protein
MALEDRDYIRERPIYGPQRKPQVGAQFDPPPKDGWDRTLGIARPPQYARAKRRYNRRSLAMGFGLGFITAFVLLAVIIEVARLTN